MTAEIMKTCALTCQPGSIVEITVAQFLALGDAAQELSDDAKITLLENPDAPEVPEIVENASEIPEAESEPETPEKKPKRRKKD